MKGVVHVRYTEAMELKAGDLVILDNRTKYYGGLILEIESINPLHDNWCYRVTLKQPGFNGSFRIVDYDTRHLKRYGAD